MNETANERLLGGLEKMGFVFDEVGRTYRLTEAGLGSVSVEPPEVDVAAHPGAAAYTRTYAIVIAHVGEGHAAACWAASLTQGLLGFLDGLGIRRRFRVLPWANEDL
jgi:hypothetical protein